MFLRFQKYFHRVSIDLGKTDSVNNPTNIRIEQFAKGNDPQLAALYFQFGRYLLISSSQPGGQPATLQGLWNDQLYPPWDSKYTVNINTEMNYWPSEVTNLSEMNEPLIQMIRELSETGKQTRKRHVWCSGLGAASQYRYLAHEWSRRRIILGHVADGRCMA
jgi:alpha-L-fucosidase 2